MKLIRYVDVYPGCDPATLNIYEVQYMAQLFDGWKRYKITIEIPDPEPPGVSGDAVVSVQEEKPE